MHTFSDWTDLLADAGARTCGKCGKTAMIPASPPNDRDTGDRVAPAAALGRDVSLWVCFECGHEDHRPLA
jgi:hypothetical protein